MIPIPSRVALRHLHRQAGGYDPYQDARKRVEDGLKKLRSSMGPVLKKMATGLKKHGLVLDQEKSDISWRVHGSDGLRMDFELVVSDAKKDDPRTGSQVEQAFKDEFDMWITPQMRGTDWLVSMGDY